MYEFILKKDGKIVTKDKNKLVKTTLLPYLSRYIELEDGYTLRSYFKTIIKYQELQFLDVFFESFIEEFKSCKKSKCVCSNIECIEIKKEVGTSKESYGDELTECCILHGKAIDSKEAGGDYYAIEMTPLKELLDLPIKIAPTLFYSVDNTKHPYKQFNKEYPDHNLTLYEFITGIIFELSFHGTPTTRNDAVVELGKRIEEVDEAIANGTAKCTKLTEHSLDYIKNLLEK